MEILQGIDLLEVERIKKIYLNYENKFLKKILTDSEESLIKVNDDGLGTRLGDGLHHSLSQITGTSRYNRLFVP